MKKCPVLFDQETTCVHTEKDCVLHFSISGTKQGVRDKLSQMIAEIDDTYGKPIQGVVSSFKSVSHVITPVWNGERY